MKHSTHPIAFRRTSHTLPPMLIVLGVLASGTTQATVLQFDQTRSAVSGGIVEPVSAGADLPHDYGDRVGGSPQSVSGGQYTYGNEGEGYTPNVEIAYFLSNAVVPEAVQMWTIGYGDLSNVIFGLQGSEQLNILFTADPGYTVELYGFDLAGWPNQDYTINRVEVLEGVTSLFSQSNVLVEGDAIGPTHTRFDFSTPLAGAGLLIQIDYSNIPASQQDNIGLDNLRFSQFPSPVPEPSTWAFFLAGCGLLAWVARRRSASFYP
jgi:hypothetical protein